MKVVKDKGETSHNDVCMCECVFPSSDFMFLKKTEKIIFHSTFKESERTTLKNF